MPSRSLPFDLSVINLSERARKATKMDFDIQPEHLVALVQQGTWSVLPFAKVLPFTNTFGKVMVGIRLLPGQALVESPVVVCSANKILTVSTSLRTALPMLIYRYKLHESRLGWDSLRELWPEVESELIELHTAMGGEDRLEGLHSVLFDNKLYPKEANTREVFEEAVRESLERLDPNPQHLLYRKYLHQALTRPDVSLPIPEGLGPWKSGAAVVALQTSCNMQNQQQDQLLAAWEVVRAPASLDTATPRTIQHLFRPSDNGDMRVAKAAQLLAQYQDQVPEEWKHDPIWSATIALTNEGKAYTGIAHVEAAQALNEMGQPIYAFDALMSAAFWSYQAQGEALIATIDAARYLAANHHWKEVGEVLEALATHYNKQP